MNIQINTDHISNEDSSLDINLKKIQFCIAKDNSSELIKFIKDLHNADIAEIIQNLDEDTRLEFIKRIKENFDPEILTYLNESIRGEIIELLDIKQLATNASELDVDDAVDVIEDLEESDQEAFLDNLSESERKLIEEGLNYPEDSAGRLMQRKFVSISDEWNVGETIDYLRTNTKELPEDFYEIYLTNGDNKISGIVPLG
jgi:magnesium transporter